MLLNTPQPILCIFSETVISNYQENIIHASAETYFLWKVIMLA